MTDHDDIPHDGFITADCVNERVLGQEWFLLGQPWVHSDDAGMMIIAGDPDPHRGVPVCDVQDCFGDHLDDEAACVIAQHIVDLHNGRLQQAVDIANRPVSHHQV